MKIRIQKYLSQKGICSRRKAETYINKGWIKVNGIIVTELGSKVDPDKDLIEYDPQIKKEQEQFTYLAYYKPKDIVTNCPQNNEKEIRDLLPKKYQHLSAIGRLDKDSEGLILLTNDGIFAKKMLQTEHPHKRIYEVLLNKPLTKTQKEKLENGITLFGKKTKPLTIKKSSETLIQITLYEGKNRQIRRMIQKIGLKVINLKRIQFGPIKLENLKPNSFYLFHPDQF